MTNKKQTSKSVASQASKVLRDPNASVTQKKLAASALSQAAAGKETGKAMEATASAALKSDKYSDLTKTFAGSVVSQSDKKR
ncbi:hypothetical protein HF675_04980 [Serratia sp. JUb9]|uniref:hypothetical protein n=1 Tax=Serratia sp. JUb9 TaxID=2724469 RepID=UPI00164D54AD|nr:hypothetical protein [Serratia sp. JUb9]QNK33414.1 hypothetical protein HF675_04980 [Serratia sp. JUb9]